MDPLEEIKARIPIEVLVAEYVNLKKSGSNFKGLSPFKTEKTPSFMVSPDKGIAYCFATQQGGDIFRIYQLLEKVDFPEAVRQLAEKAGVSLRNYQASSSNFKKEAYQLMKTVIEFYQDQLTRTNEAYSYWKNRQITPEISQSFQIGYAPSGNQTTFQYLKRKGFEADLMLAVGLIGQNENGEYYDRFRERIMIPIYDHLGNPVGFGGRLIKDDPHQGKYLNSPENALYNKSQLLFGLDKAKESIKKKGYVILVEGYLDVIASHQAGETACIGVSGTALTNEQLQLIKRYTSHLKLCFDQDSAGREANKRAIQLATSQDFSVEIILIENSKDVDELVQKSPENWLKSVENGIPPFDFFFLESQERFDIKKTEDRQKIVNELFPKIAWFSSTVLQQTYLKKLAESCQLNLKLLMEEFAGFKKNHKNHLPLPQPESHF
ncbi:MAG TPA: DNA primase, partial [Candidatus Gracilibacteria bacterium]|nr:DNA primase [Candidatus Gracilibacteria bacterium]